MTSLQPYVPQSLGERIAHARRLLGVKEGVDLAVPDLAKRVGVTAASLYNWEADGAVPGEANFSKLATVLGVTPAWLRYGVVESLEKAPPPKGGVVGLRVNTVTTKPPPKKGK